MVYVINNVSILLEAYCFRHIKGIGSKRFFLAVCLVQLTLIIGLRDGVGADFYSYLKIYNYIDGIWQYQYRYRSVEFGYELLNKICTLVGIPFWGLNLIIAFITNYFLIKAIQEFHYNPYLSIFLYISLFFFYHSMNQVRQGMAMTIGLYALSQLSKKKNKKFFIFLILAELFHIVAITYLPLFFLSKLKIKRIVICQYVFITIITIIFWESFAHIISMTRYADFVNSIFDIKLTLNTIVNLVVRIVLAVFALKNIKKYLKFCVTECEYNIMCHMILLSIVFQMLTTFCSSFLGRVTTPYFMIYIIVFPAIIDNMYEKSKKNIYTVGFYLFGALYQLTYYIVMGKAVLTNEYSCILFK